MALTLADRFWAKVDKRGPDECWPWLGAKLSDGRGKIRDGGRIISAPRASLILDGRDPRNLHALHLNECHNPNCVNPAHLYGGTSAQNAADCIAFGNYKGHAAPKGSKNYQAKLHERDIPDIRDLSILGVCLRKLAIEFKVSTNTIWKVVAGKTWGHV